MSKLIPLLITTAILFFIDFYAFQAIRTAMHHSSVSWKRIVMIVYWLISITSISFIWYIVYFDWYSLPKVIRVYMFSALFVFYVPKLILSVFVLMDDVVRLVRWIASYFHSSNSTSAAPHRISRSNFLHNRFGRFRILLFSVFLRNDSHGVQLQIRRVKIPVKDFAGSFQWNENYPVSTSTPEVSPAKNRWRNGEDGER